MVKTDTIEGTIGSGARRLWFHYDIGADVLYLRRESHRETATYAEETPDGLLLRTQRGNRPVGLTVVNWWKRFGRGRLPDSIQRIGRSIEPWAEAIAA
jgi:hypothetical protein